MVDAVVIFSISTSGGCGKGKLRDALVLRVGGNKYFGEEPWILETPYSADIFSGVMSSHD
jgi:hypothetical protein